MFNKEKNELINQVENELENIKIQAALKTTIKIRNIAYKEDNQKFLAYYYLFIGNIEFLLDHFDIALENYLSGLYIAEGLTEKDLIIKFQNCIGKNYAFMGNYDKALSHLNRAIKLDENNYKCLNHIGLVNQYLGKYELANEFFYRTLSIVKKNKNDKEIVRTLINIGRNIQNRDLGKALEIYTSALNIAEKGNYLNLIGVLKLFMANCYEADNNFSKAIKYLLSALEISKVTNDLSIEKNCYHYLAQVYKKHGDTEKALLALQNYIDMQEKVFSQTMETKVNLIQDRYDEDKKKLEESNVLYKERLEKLQYAYSDIVGIGKIGFFSSEMREVNKIALLLHEQKTTSVLIEGETGTGKEIVARVIHYGKGKEVTPFITLNCSAVSPTLFESELFGYADGAFTGAKRGGKIGLLELANGGTLFLDEIGDMPLDQQPKLLRVIQQKEFYRIGGVQKIKLNLRIIAATNKDLKEEIAKKNFRSDLYYRLNIGSICITPLRERKIEIAPLAQMFLLKNSKEKRRSFKYLSNDAIELLQDYDWPGNIRELQNAIERVVLLYDNLEAKKEYFNFISNSKNNSNFINDKLIIDLPDSGMKIDDIDREIIEVILRKFQGNQTKAAEYLGVSRYTVIRKKKKYNL